MGPPHDEMKDDDDDDEDGDDESRKVKSRVPVKKPVPPRVFEQEQVADDAIKEAERTVRKVPQGDKRPIGFAHPGKKGPPATPEPQDVEADFWRSIQGEPQVDNPPLVPAPKTIEAEPKTEQTSPKLGEKSAGTLFNPPALFPSKSTLPEMAYAGETKWLSKSAKVGLTAQTMMEKGATDVMAPYYEAPGTIGQEASGEDTDAVYYIVLPGSQAKVPVPTKAVKQTVADIETNAAGFYADAADEVVVQGQPQTGSSAWWNKVPTPPVGVTAIGAAAAAGGGAGLFFNWARHLRQMLGRE